MNKIEKQYLDRFEGKERLERLQKLENGELAIIPNPLDGEGSYSIIEIPKKEK